MPVDRNRHHLASKTSRMDHFCRHHPPFILFGADITQRQRRVLQRRAFVVGAFGDFGGFVVADVRGEGGDEH